MVMFNYPTTIFPPPMLIIFFNSPGLILTPPPIGLLTVTEAVPPFTILNAIPIGHAIAVPSVSVAADDGVMYIVSATP